MIPEEVSQYIGRQYAPHIRVVETGAIRRYAEAIDDDNPLYCDEGYARNSRYGAVIAPPGFFGWPKKAAVMPQAMVEVRAALVKAGYSRLLDGGISYEFDLPLRESDTLVASMKVKDIYEREGKSGSKMIFVVFETSYLNQNGDLVARAYHTIISR